MMDRVHRPIRMGVLMLLLSASFAFCAEGDSGGQPDLADLLKQAAEARERMNEQIQQQQEMMRAVESGQAPPEKPAAARQPKASSPRGGKGASTPAKEKPKGFSDIRQTLEGSFDLHVQDADARTVLRQLSAQAKTNIVTSSQVTGTVTADLYGVDFQEALDAVVEAAGLVYQKREGVFYVFTPAEMALRRDEMPIEARVFHLAYLRAATARDLINGMLSPKGKAMITPEEHTSIESLPPPTWDQQRLRNVAEDVLVVHDYEYILDKVEAVIKKVDVKPEQVLIEATILSAQLDDDNALGVDLQGLIGNNFNTFRMTSDLTNMRVGVGGGVNDFSHWQSRVNTNFSQNMPNTFGPPFTFGIVYDNVGAFVHALESVRDVTVLANPKLLIVNKQRGEVLVGRSDGYLTTVVTDTSAIQQVEFLETGTRLIVRPFVGANDHVRLEIHPEDSNGQVAPVEEGGPALPRKTTSEVTTNIIVRDGKTVVIAGLFRDQVQTTRRQVPLLGDIPWMGTLFRSTVDTTTRSEVIVLITPHIIRDTSAEAVGERMRGVAERYRIGARQGLRWWGRNRLSANYLKWANQAWTEGDLEKARWWLDLCLSLQPDLVEAMLLKERMTDEAGWANPPQFTDARFIVTRMLMQEIGRDVDTVLPPRRPLHDGDLTPEVRKALGVELKPTTSGVIRREENYVPVRRGNSSVPGAVDMVPATAAPPKDQVSPKPKPSKPETAPKKPDKPTPPVMKTKPAKKPEPVKTPKPKPAELKSAKKAEPKPAETRKPKPAPTKPAVKPEPTQPKPAEQPKPKVEPKPETKPKPAEKPKPKVEAKPEEQPKSEETPKPAPQPAPSKEPESSGEPRPAPIQDQPVAPTPDPNVSPSAVRAKPAPKPAEPVKISSPPPLSDTLESEATPEKKSETQTKQPSAEPRKESPKPKSNHRQPLEEYKSPAQQHLDSGTLSALLKQSAADTNRKTATR